MFSRLLVLPYFSNHGCFFNLGESTQNGFRLNILGGAPEDNLQALVIIAAQIGSAERLLSSVDLSGMAFIVLNQVWLRKEDWSLCTVAHYSCCFKTQPHTHSGGFLQEELGSQQSVKQGFMEMFGGWKTGKCQLGKSVALPLIIPILSVISIP